MITLAATSSRQIRASADIEHARRRVKQIARLGMTPRGHINDLGRRPKFTEYACASKNRDLTPCDVEMYAVAACGLTVARSSAVRAS